MRIDHKAKMKVQSVYIRGNAMPLKNCTVYFADDFLVVESTETNNRGECPIFYNKRFVHRLVGVIDSWTDPTKKEGETVREGARL